MRISPGDIRVGRGEKRVEGPENHLLLPAVITEPKALSGGVTVSSYQLCWGQSSSSTHQPQAGGRGPAGVPESLPDCPCHVDPAGVSESYTGPPGVPSVPSTHSHLLHTVEIPRLSRHVGQVTLFSGRREVELHRVASRATTTRYHQTYSGRREVLRAGGRSWVTAWAGGVPLGTAGQKDTLPGHGLRLIVPGVVPALLGVRAESLTLLLLNTSINITE